MDSITQVFSQKNVQEMQQLEHKTRHEIELKKEELRQMVGERYRDLIEAADTIGEMKICSTLVKESITDLQEFCSSKSLIKGRRMSLLKKQKASKDINRYMEIAAEAKVLMEMPEKIWSFVEAGQMITASFLYLQSLQVLKNLSLDGTTTYSPVLLWFPMLGQQAQAVGNLRTAILKECRSRLHDHLLHTDLLAEALCSIVILEKISVSETLRALLKGRLAVLRATLTGGSFGGEMGKSVGAKAQICDSATIIKQTVGQVHDLFCLENGGLLAQLLDKCNCQSSQNLTSSFHSHTDPSKIWTKHLPSHTTSCLVSIDSDSAVLPSEVVQSCCLTWFSDCEREIKQGIENLLKFTTTAKDLASIRTSLLQALAEDTDSIDERTEVSDKWRNLEIDSVPKAANKWLTTCKVVFNRDIKLWKELIQNLFIEKVNSIVKETFSELLTKSKTIFTQPSEASSHFEDICSYVWQEHDDDISANMTWIQWQARKQRDLGSQGGLSLKAATVTPDIQEACQEINETMVHLLTDLNHYVCDAIAENTGSNASYSSPRELSRLQSNAPKNKAVTDHLKTSCYHFLHMLITHIKGLKLDLSSNIENPARKQVLVDHVLRLSLLCRNFFELCHSFKQCCCPYDTNTAQSSFRRQLSGSSSKSKTDTTRDADIVAWTAIVQDMTQESRNFMTLWCNSVLNDALKKYKEALLASALNENLLNSVTLWDSITVEEESETGDKVTSLIQIPSSTTSYTQELMHRLCSEVNRVGGFSASRCILRGLSLGCLNGFYEAFSEARRTLSSGDTNLHGQNRSTSEAATPSQSWALQCLFDLRYAHNLLHHSPSIGSDKDEEEDDLKDDDVPLYTFTELVDWLEGYIDPFDLDVFSPHITRNIQRHMARTCVLLGMLTSPEKITSSSSEKLATATKDSHNVLPLIPDCGRFSYLPVSGRSTNSRSRLASSISHQHPLSSTLRDLTHSSVDDDEKNQQNKLTSSIYSKLGALSSSWLSMSSSYTED